MTHKPLIITITLVLLAGMLFAQGVTHKKMRVPASPTQDPRFKDRLTPMDAPMSMHQMLNLSKEQEAKLETIKNEHQKQMIDLKAAIEKINIDIKDAFKNEKYDLVKTLNVTLYTKKREIADAHIDHIQAMLSELNAEQKEIAKEHFQSMGNKGMGMGGQAGFSSRKQHHNKPMKGCGRHSMGGGMKEHPGFGMHQRIRDPENCAAQENEKGPAPNAPKPDTKTEK